MHEEIDALRQQAAEERRSAGLKVDAIIRIAGIGLVASAAGAIAATMQTSGLAIAGAAGIAPFILVAIARAGAGSSALKALLLAQAFALIGVTSCTVGMTDEDGVASEIEFERLWVASVWVGSILGGLAGHRLGSAIARWREGRRSDSGLAGR